MSHYTTTKTWEQKALESAAEAASDLLSQIVEQLIDNGEASEDISSNYGRDGEGIEHSWCDFEPDLMECAEILRDLRRWEEDDSGLWHGLQPRQAIACQAAFTYRNAVANMWRELLSDINSADDVQDIIGREPLTLTPEQQSVEPASIGRDIGMSDRLADLILSASNADELLVAADYALDEGSEWEPVLRTYDQDGEALQCAKRVMLEHVVRSIIDGYAV